MSYKCHGQTACNDIAPTTEGDAGDMAGGDGLAPILRKRIFPGGVADVAIARCGADTWLHAGALPAANAANVGKQRAPRTCVTLADDGMQRFSP